MLLLYIPPNQNIKSGYYLNNDHKLECYKLDYKENNKLFAEKELNKEFFA